MTWLLLVESAFQDGREVGRIVGVGIVCVLAAAAIFTAVKRMLQPEGQTQCLLSFVFFLAAWIVGAVGQTFAGEALSPAKFALLLVQVVLNLVAIILGILGLIEFRRDRDRYSYGAKRAGLSVVLGIGVLLLGGVIFVVALERAKPREIETEATAQGTVDFPELNVSLAVPPSPWVRFDVSTMSPDAAIGFMRTNPAAYFMMIAETAGVEAGITTPMLAELVMGNLRSGGENVEVLSQGEHVVDGVEGLRIRSAARVAGNELTYAHWVAAPSGFQYQLILFADRKHSSYLNREADSIFSLFRRLDPERVAHTPGVTLIDRHDDPTLGYSVDLTGLGWREWGELEEQAPHASFGALRDDSMAMVVAPLSFPADHPPLADLIPTFVSRMDFEYPSQAFEDPSRIRHGGLPGFSLETERSSSGGSSDYTYQLRFVQAESTSYFLAAWGRKGDVQSDELVQVLERIEIAPDAPHVADRSVDEPRRSEVAAMVASLAYQAQEAQRYEDALALYTRALEAHPDRLEYLSGRMRNLSQLKRYEDALATFREHHERFEDNLDFRSWLPYLQRMKGDTDGAAESYEALFAAGYEDENELLGFVNLLVDAGRFDEAIEQLETFLERRSTMRVRRWLATVHSRKGDHESAIRQLVAMRDSETFEVGLGYDLADVYLDANRPQAAIDVCEDLLERGYDTPRTYQLRGRAEMALRWYRKAKASFELGLAKAPGDAALESDVRAASGFLGQGNNSEIKTAIPVVALPEELREAIHGAGEVEGAPNGNEGRGVRYAARVQAIHFESGKPSRTTLYRTADVLTLDGANEMSSLPFDYDPLRESIFVNRVVVRGPDGDVVAKASVEDHYIVDGSGRSEATHDKTVHVPVPGVTPGCRIEYEVTWRTKGALERFDFIEHSFSTRADVGRSALVIRGDVANLRFEGSAGVEPRRGKDWIAWILEDPPRYRSEPMQAPSRVYLPEVRVADRRLAWKEEAIDYLRSIEDVLELDDETRELAASLTADAESSRQKIRALATYVQQELKYKAIEFGRRGSIPNACGRILSDRYGDCKDHSLLLHQLLASVGIESDLALISTYGGVSTELPTLDVFNHMIVYVRAANDEPAMFVDCTDKNTDVLAATPLGLPSMNVLVLDATNPRFESTPPYADPASELASDRRIGLDAADDEASGRRDARVTETVRLRGLYAGSMRRFLRGMDASERLPAIGDILESYATVQVTSMEVGGLEDPAAELVIELVYTIEGAFRFAEGRWLGTVPWLFEKDYLRVDRLEERTSPFRSRSTRRHTSRVRLTLPDGFSSGSLDWANRRESSAFAAWTMDGRVDDDVLLLERDLRVPALGTRPPEEYEPYCRALLDSLEPFEHPLVLERDPD